MQKDVTTLRNPRRELHQKLRIPLMEQLAETMMILGYRRGVLESGVACYQRQLTASDQGEVPLYRPRDWQAPARRRKKQLAKMAWFRSADTVLRVPCTPEEALATSERHVVYEEGDRLGLKARVQEGAGVDRFPIASSEFRRNSEAVLGTP